MSETVATSPTPSHIGPDETGNPRVLIIGAGPAGLTAAWELLRKSDCKPIIIEALDSIGGLSRTENHHGNHMDLGGHRFFTRSKIVRKLWEELLPLQGAPAWDDRLLGRRQAYSAGGPDPELTDRVMLIRSRLSRIYFNGHFFDYPVTLSAQTLKNLGLIQALQVGLGYLRSVFHKRPEHSLEDFYINRFGRPLYELFFESYTEKLWGRHPAEISPDWGAQRVKGLSLGKAIWSFLAEMFHLKRPNETSLIDTFHYPKFGPGQLWETMADEITRLGGEIVLQAKVERIELRPGFTSGFKVEASTRDGKHKVYTGEALFSSMPVKDLASSLIPPPPRPILDIATQLPYRDFITVGVLARRMDIQNTSRVPSINQIVPDCWIYIQDRQVKLGRLQIFNNWSPYLLRDPEHTVWLGLEYFCTEGDELWSLPDNAFMDMAAAELATLGILQQDEVLERAIVRVRKAYPAYFDSFNQFASIREYLDAIPCLFCIGRNGQHRYNNMDHSMLTGIEAVQCFLGQQGGNAMDKSRVWDVNSEQTYAG
ncbi:MAG: NAD(P)/FAD-dependent oxidoreductase [Clostridia bacterium]|nr:NAD(P)/FAD-dependent oxidoreductase [Clostridia bacterium]